MEQVDQCSAYMWMCRTKSTWAGVRRRRRMAWALPARGPRCGWRRLLGTADTWPRRLGTASEEWAQGGPRGALAVEWVEVAARMGNEEKNEGKLYRCFIIRGTQAHMSTGLRVWILFFQTHYKIPVRFRVVPTSVPTGTNSYLYPRPLGLLTVATRVLCTRCHL
jgi:hypothetical protein